MGRKSREKKERRARQPQILIDELEATPQPSGTLGKGGTVKPEIGGKSKALCPMCNGMRATTYLEREVPFRHGEGSAPGVLAAVCDECGTVAGIPHQSVPRISAVLAQSQQDPTP